MKTMSDKNSISVLYSKDEIGYDVFKSYGAKKVPLYYKGINLDLTKKQVFIMHLVAFGMSNTRIASKLGIREAAVKLFVYRLMRKLEMKLLENIDRFYLIILAQDIVSVNSLVDPNIH